MCYPKPGPRCSGHARDQLQKAKAAVNRPESTDEDIENYISAREEYYMTPAGMRLLRKKIDTLPEGSEEREKAQFKYDIAADKRRDSLNLLRVSYNENSEGSDSSHQEEAPTTPVTGAFASASAIDPEGCGCTECITGQSTNAGSFSAFAEDGDIARFADGGFSMNISEQERLALAGKMLNQRTDISEDSRRKLLKSMSRPVVQKDGFVEVTDMYSPTGNVQIASDGTLSINEFSYDEQPGRQLTDEQLQWVRSVASTNFTEDASYEYEFEGEGWSSSEGRILISAGQVHPDMVNVSLTDSDYLERSVDMTRHSLVNLIDTHLASRR